MRIWYLGDSLLTPVIQNFAAAHNAELVDSSSPNPIMEEVWVIQTADKRMRRYTGPCIVIIFLNIKACDSETITYRATLAAPQAKFIFLVAPEDETVKEGYMHFEGKNFNIVDLEKLDADYVLSKIEAAAQ
jgi:hypothetical protein